MRILIVDDNTDTARTLQLLFRLCACEAQVAKTGAEAIILAATYKPDAIIVDLAFPGRSRYEAAKQLHGSPGLGAVPIIAVSGWPNDPVQAAEAGIAHHFLKPFLFDELRQVLGLLPAAS